MQFSKNPFANSTTKAKIVSNYTQYNEKAKLDNIREKMSSIKTKPTITEQPNIPKENLSVKARIDILKNLNKNK